MSLCKVEGRWWWVVTSVERKPRLSKDSLQPIGMVKRNQYKSTGFQSTTPMPEKEKKEDKIQVNLSYISWEFMSSVQCMWYLYCWC